MRSFKQCAAWATALAAAVSLSVAGTALAVFPNFSDCPRTAPGVIACVDIQNTSANMNIKGFNVPLGDSLEIRGALTPFSDGIRFVPPTGTNGFFARAVPVPGGLLGIDWIPGNRVMAITELAGPASSIRINPVAGTISLPIKVRLVNVLLGMNCHIGTNTNPVVLNLITGTTSPPPPNMPITGRLGTFSFSSDEIGTILTATGNHNVENSYAVPGATSCGLGLGLVNSLVNAKLKLPSAAGNNSIEVFNNLALREPA